MTRVKALSFVVAPLVVALGAGTPLRASGQERGAPDRAEAAAAAVASSAWSLRSSDSDGIETRWGVRIVGIYSTAGGYMLDFRFRVVDPAKAAPLFDRAAKPLLTDERSGAVMAVPVPPKTGPLRSSNDPKAGRTYFVFFANPRQFVRPYSAVTVTIGAFSVSGLTVK